MPAETRYAATDVYYPAAGGATAAIVVATEPTFADLVAEHVIAIGEVAPYRPGAFFERELPALSAVVNAAGRLDMLIVDGYATLDPDGRPGLGARAHEAFGIPVIGVAKTAFKGATHAVEVYRGASRRALYVTAIGITADVAADLVRAMAGEYRMPDALRRVDALSRQP